ncbi:stage III sporulation protein AA [Anaerosinus massiliensis]|uniref:stage III sporulation protein AA n=1 Tax=Massilibacillus massiliensis TaxID=1806837 RepID=UPI000A694710|nr:stage III sporulation protein AA [Massilibacillus massiliensis]
MVNTIEKIRNDIYPYLPLHMIHLLKQVDFLLMNQVIEIRLRVNQPFLLVLPDRMYTIQDDGVVNGDLKTGYICNKNDISNTIQAMTKNSFYALEQELRMGYITLEGGHRVGLAGQAILNDGKLKAIKNISSINIRISREVKNCAKDIMRFLIDRNQHIFSTLIIAPPRCGKTTLLRDIVRSFSRMEMNFSGVQVGVVDERSEITACKNGIPTLDIGYCVDVLDGCPKATGILMLIRSMAPDVIVTDELGREEDVIALNEALHAGVSVITSVHGKNLEDVKNRPYVKQLIEEKYFERYIVLTNQPKIGSVQEIIDVKKTHHLFSKTNEKEEFLCC